MEKYRIGVSFHNYVPDQYLVKFIWELIWIFNTILLRVEKHLTLGSEFCQDLR